MKLTPILALAIFLPAAVAGAAGPPPLALAVEVQPLGQGTVGTVMGLVLQVAPEDRDRVGERARVTTTLLSDGQVADRQSAVVSFEEDGSALLYRDWKAGSYELRVAVEALEGTAAGLWIGDVKVTPQEERFEAPEDATADAVALAVTPPERGAVRFQPPPRLGGLGAVQLEVEAPESTGYVEFFHDGEPMGRRNRPPWTISVPLGEVVRRSLVTAVARTPSGDYLGEDAIVLNNPTGRLGVEILLAPETSVTDGKRQVTVSVTSTDPVHQVTLDLDDRRVARWAECPCVASIPVSELEDATILSADATDAAGARGDAVLTLGGGGGFVGTVTVELVELPVVVLDQQESPVTGLEEKDFTVSEDGRPVELEGFGTTADLPLSLAVAVDISGSMVEVFPQVREAVAGFADDLLETGDQVVLLTFSWDAQVVLPWTTDVGLVDDRLDRVEPEGGTSLHDAVVRSLEQFRGRRGRQAVVLLTDGEDTTSRTDLEATVRFARTMRIPIFPIGLGVGRLDFQSRRFLKELATETGGELFLPKKAEDLPEVYARISELLRSQYLLWYRSSSTKPADEFREVEVTVDKPEVAVRTISGYYPGK